MNSKLRIVSVDLARIRSLFLLLNTMLAAVALLLAGTTSAQTDNHPDNTTASLGITNEKPTEGPFVEVDGSFMVPYTHQIPGTEVTFKMIPIAGGVFKMGSTDDDAQADVTPAIEVAVKPFWIGKHEVKWAEYQQYMALDAAFKKLHRNKLRKVTSTDDIDAVTAPSALYEPDITYEAGEEPDQPAASMTQFAAKQYTKWLSLLTGTVYRLPYESEWEYACRAGTTTKYYFGDDESLLEEHGWFYDNSSEERHACGELPPNPWGLFDLYGNVSEWVLDAYTPEGYGAATDAAITVEESFRKPTAVYPRVLRGGSFFSEAELCNSVARLASDDKPWKEEDPNYPKSPWWYTCEEGLGAGMRIVRPFDTDISDEQKTTYWDADVEAIKRDAFSRIDSNGRGSIGIVDQQLDEDLANLEE